MQGTRTSLFGELSSGTYLGYLLREYGGHDNKRGLWEGRYLLSVETTRRTVSVPAVVKPRWSDNGTELEGSKLFRNSKNSSVQYHAFSN